MRNLLLRLDLIRLSLKGHLREAAEQIIEVFDVTGRLSEHDLKVAIGLVRAYEGGRI